ncbi:MAG: protein kinase [Deltaproteobacteria bacterium]|nr:protein kinase [Deltaproteobacteria bacterium]
MEATCPDDLALWAWLDGRVDRDLDAHLDQCPRCLRAVAALGAQTEAVAHETLDAAGRYEVVGAIAAGGMGRVILARDARLDREVAIKVVRDPDRPQLISRLERELAITARLQHPSILPVHDAGTTIAGEPFFVMPRVVGESLHAAVAARPAFVDRLALVPAVARAVDAIAYAHAQGVLHRDLKPANVMLGAHGETLVIDWGLAVAMHEATPDGAMPALAIGSGTTTATGAVLGTLGYMSPEQLAGRDLDARTDVYGLGGILYHTLAGCAPHAGDDGARLERPRPIRAIAPDVPAELAAIVERALADDPAARYASAGELAGELRRFLDGQLVGAHRYTLAQLLRRFVARHRAAVIASAVAVIAIAVIGAIAVQQVVASREVAETERAEAQRRGDAADELIAFSLGDLHERLGAVGRLDVIRTVNDAVLRHYRAMPARAGAAGVTDRIRESDVLGLSGDERRAAGDAAAAMDFYVRSEARAADAAAHAGDDQRAQVERANCRAQQRLADAWADRGDLDKAEAALRQALRHAEAASAAGDGGHLAPDTLISLAMLARRRGDDAAGKALLEQARPLAEAAAQRDPDRSALRSLVVLLDELGTLAYERGDTTEAGAIFDANLRQLQARPPTDPDDAEYLEQLATLWSKVATGRVAAGDQAGAKAGYEQARDVAVRLLKRDPNNVQWLDILETAHHGVGKRALALGDAALARTELTASLDLAQKIAMLTPADPQARHSVAISALSLGALLQDQGDLPGAVAQLGTARAILEQLVDSASAADKDDVRGTLGAVLLQLAQVHGLRHDQAAADAAAARAVELTGAVMTAEPTPLHRMQHAEALLVAHDLRARPEFLTEARAALESLRATATPDDARLTGLLDELFPTATRAGPTGP